MVDIQNHEKVACLSHEHRQLYDSRLPLRFTLRIPWWSADLPCRHCSVDLPAAQYLGPNQARRRDGPYTIEVLTTVALHSWGGRILDL